MFNPLMGTIKLQSNRPLYSKLVNGKLADNGWTVTFGTARRGLGSCSLVQQAVVYNTKLQFPLVPYNMFTLTVLNDK